jgi:hypothetical protein
VHMNVAIDTVFQAERKLNPSGPQPQETRDA